MRRLHRLRWYWWWAIGAALSVGLPALGVPLWLTVLLAAPAALLAGWSLTGWHKCGWCGRSFDGPYDWCCPTCARDERLP